MDELAGRAVSIRRSMPLRVRGRRASLDDSGDSEADVAGIRIELAGAGGGRVMRLCVLVLCGGLALVAGCGWNTTWNCEGCKIDRYFTSANAWVDANEDGMLQESELEGQKGYFRSGEDLRFVAEISTAEGTQVEGYVKGPGGGVVDVVRGSQPQRRYVQG